MNSGGPCEVPLVELLERTPSDARLTYEHSSTCHSMIPVGLHAQRAAAELRSLQSKLHELSKIDEAFQKAVDETDFFADRCKELERERDALALRLDEVTREREIYKKLHVVAGDQRDQAMEALKAAESRLDSACRIEHEWRTSTFLEYTTPHWVCKHCGKAEGKKHDEMHLSERVVETQRRNCLRVNCTDPARDGSNYCQAHAPEDWPRKTRP